MDRSDYVRRELRKRLKETIEARARDIQRAQKVVRNDPHCVVCGGLIWIEMHGLSSCVSCGELE